jgi:hypothetical protein
VSLATGVLDGGEAAFGSDAAGVGAAPGCGRVVVFLRGLGEHVRGDGDGLLSAAGLEMVGGLQDFRAVPVQRHRGGAERAADLAYGRGALEQAAAGRQPETNATVAELMDKYTEVADWDLSTRKANSAYIRRVVKPALGHLQVRKIRGPLLDLLYAQLRR